MPTTYNTALGMTDPFVMGFLNEKFAPYIQAETSRLEKLFANGPLLTSQQVTEELSSGAKKIEGAFPAGSLSDQFNAYLQQEAVRRGRQYEQSNTLSNESLRHNHSLVIQYALIREIGCTFPTDDLADAAKLVGIPILEIGAGSGLVGKRICDQDVKYFASLATRYYAVDNKFQSYEHNYPGVNPVDGIHALAQCQNMFGHYGINNMAVLMCYPYLRGPFGPLPLDMCMPLQALCLMNKDDVFMRADPHTNARGDALNPLFDQYLAENFEQLGAAVTLYEWRHKERPKLTVWRKRTEAHRLG